jgi:hypothetical protein
VSATFDAQVEPLRANLLSLLDASRDLRESHGSLATAESPAMAELADEARYSGAWGERPVESAHSWAGVLLVAAEDQLRTMCRIVVGEPTLYGPQSLARSGLEMSGRAYWLTEPGIGVERRITRFATERLFNASELRRLKGDVKRATEIEKQVTDTAHSLGLSLLRGKRYTHTHVSEQRPSGNEIFQSLLQDIEPYGLGHTMFSYLSAVDHGTLYGLLQAVGSGEPEGALRPAMRPLGMNSQATNQLLGIATFGYSFAATRNAELWGWADEAWTRAFGNALRHVSDVLRLKRPAPPVVGSGEGITVARS